MARLRVGGVRVERTPGRVAVSVNLLHDDTVLFARVERPAGESAGVQVAAEAAVEAVRKAAPAGTAFTLQRASSHLVSAGPAVVAHIVIDTPIGQEHVVGSALGRGGPLEGAWLLRTGRRTGGRDNQRLRHSAAAREGSVAHSESARVIALVNQKGGCAKTTTAVNLAACLASSGRRVLVIDLDPQANATVSLGVDPGSLTRTVYHVLVREEHDDGGTTLPQIIVPTTVSNLFLAPSSIDLAAAELELAARIGRENSLRKRMGPVLTEYAYIFIDTPPSLGLLTLNALVASDEIIIPIQTHYYALLGMRQLLRTLKMVREEVGHQVEILGVLPTMYDSRTNISKEIVQGIKDFFGDKVFDTSVHFNIKLVESSMVGVPLFIHDPSSRGAQEYMDLAKEVMKGHAERARGAAARH